MDGMALNIIFASTAGLAGCGLGFWLRGGGGKGDPERERALEEKATSAAAAAERAESELQAAREESQSRQRQIADLQHEVKRLQADADQARSETRSVQAAMGQLQKLAASMAANVDEHNNQMQAINDELGDDNSSADAVVSAVARLIEANAQMQEQLDTAEERLEAQQHELETQMAEARTDALTGLANRRAFDSEMIKLEMNFADTGQTSSVMMIDVDHFKKFNDTYGHQAGDEVLRGVGRVLTDQLNGEEAIVCRYGGEEFVIIFPNADVDQAAPLAEKARAAIGGSRFPFEGQELNVTASGGVAALTPNETGDEVVKRADDALYVCKEAGRDCGHIHDGENIRPMTERLMEAAPIAEEGNDNSRLDEWTGLSNGDTFRDDLQRRLAENRRGGEPLCVLMLEVDDWAQKCATETNAKTVVKATAQFLKATMREMDHVARFDDRRFVLLLPATSIDDASNVAERLRAAIDSCKLPAEGGILKFTVSLAVHEAEANDDVDSLIDRSVNTLEDLIAAGGNQCNIRATEPAHVDG